jgi:signal transduction histidine kinase
MNKQQFIVDASLIQELGDRLIGRPAIALGELVKNSFDADAATCRIEFGEDEIVIADDGHGMSEDDFRNYWMRIGTTHKVQEATSKTLHRPLTGSKGIGRLSAQFLAFELTLESTSVDDPTKSLYAFVDWSTAVAGNNLSTVNVDWEMRTDQPLYVGNKPSGTRITLKRLKNQWAADSIKGLGDEVWMLRSPFRQPISGAKARAPEDFTIEIHAPQIADAREKFDERLKTVFLNWKARIRGSLDDGRSGKLAVVSVEFRSGYPEGSQEDKRFRETVPLPVRKNGGSNIPLLDKVDFEILIFKPEGRQPGGISVGDLRKYLADFGNVSVYDTGFRLPYYGSKKDKIGEDWLSIAADQGKRLNVSDLLPDHLKTQNKYMQDLPAPGRIFGAVDIATNYEREKAEKSGSRPGECLEILSGRDRLKDNEAFYQLRDLVRFALDFYANRFRLLDLQAIERNQEQEPASQKYNRVITLLDRSKKDLPPPVFRNLKREVTEARKASAAEERATDRRAALLAPLASAGMAALALNHEISRENSRLSRIATELRRIAEKHAIKELKELADEFDQARSRLESLYDLFAPLLSDMDKSATDRLRVRPIVEQCVEAMRALMPGIYFDLWGIPPDLRFPLGSLAEWNALLQNVLSNAWNAMLDSEKSEITFRGGRDSRGHEWLRVSDTGQGLSIPLSDAEKLFEPFERRVKISNDRRSLAIGGQGLGLAIVRMIARRRSTDVRFVEPQEGFSTTFEIAWKGTKK